MIRALVILCATLGLPAQADGLDPGERLFGLHCAVCHGVDARGGGTMAQALTISPPDLTVLSQARNGDFPTAAVIQQIDGRAAVQAHGGVMPVYGWFFQGSPVDIATPDGITISTSVPIAQIITWLETLQRVP